MPLIRDHLGVVEAEHHYLAYRSHGRNHGGLCPAQQEGIGLGRVIRKVLFDDRGTQKQEGNQERYGSRRNVSEMAVTIPEPSK